MAGYPDDVARNRRHWEATSGEYQATHFADLPNGLSDTECKWGVWGISENRLRVLGDVRGKDVLELGCGGAFWSIRLAKRGAKPVGLDFSASQLAHARRLMAIATVDFPLMQASADSVPLPDESFDIVFCDHGAMSWIDPVRAVPEVSRLLRPGGLFAFNAHTPFKSCCEDDSVGVPVDRLCAPYFDRHRVEVGDLVFYHMTYGGWIRLFRENGLVVEDLIELQPPENATTTFTTYASLEWARQWPAEQIWKVRKKSPRD